jgi:endonuclease YncB( thermonuclease family)
VAVVVVGAFFLALNWPLGTPSAVATAPLVEIAQPQSNSSTPNADDFSCDVDYVHDGDTLRCRDGTRVRLHAVAAREADGSCAPGHPCPAASAETATRELRRLADGKSINCRPTGRSYNRITAICWTPEGVEINCAMIESGAAVIWDRFNRQNPLCAA